MMLDDFSNDASVLVVIMNHPNELQRTRELGWYRIPLRSAPRMLAVDLLAFYQTAAFAGQRWAVRFYAPVLNIQLSLRRDLLPDQADHPRANDRYYRFNLGPLAELPVPVPSRKLRRMTFIATSVGQLLRASDLTDLWQPPEFTPDASQLWGAGVGRR
jgi:hypothetical protein